MQTLEQELAFVDNTNDTCLLSVDTKFNPEIASSPQVSPSYDTSGNPLVSQYTHKIKQSFQPPPQAKSSPLQGPYTRDKKLNPRNLNARNEPLPDVTQHGCNQLEKPTPMIFQQVVQSPFFVNLGPNVQQVQESKPALVQLDRLTQINPSNNIKQTNQPLLLQNNTKGVPLILKSSDANFSPVLLQSNIINPETQTLMYTSAPIQGNSYLLYCKQVDIFGLYIYHYLLQLIILLLITE